MKNSNHPAIALLLVLALSLTVVISCTGDDDAGISLSQGESNGTPEPSGTTPLERIGTIPLAPPSFAEQFAELRSMIEAQLESSPLTDEVQLDELVLLCDGAQASEEEQFQGCIDLLELLVAQESDDIQPLIDLTADHAGRQFPDRRGEIDEAAGRGGGTTPAGTVPLSPATQSDFAGTVPN